MSARPAVLAALFLAVTPSLAGAQPSFSTYVSVGDSLAAGFQSNALVETHQVRSVPALIARQAAVADFQQPLVSEPGLPPELVLVSLLPAPVVAPKSSTPGRPTNLALARPYNNLAVPGATAADALTRTTDAGGFHDLVLRGRGTQVAQAAALRPTAVTLWIGNNDVLGAVLRGRAVDGVTLTPAATFRATYAQVVAALKATGAFVVAANLPDVTTIPFATTLRPWVTNPASGEPVLVNGQRVPLLGPTGSLPSDALVTLAASTLLAQGIGIPAAVGGTGAPLPDEVVLDPAEVSVIRDRVTANNAAIRDICAAAGVPVVDMFGLLREVTTTGRHVGGITLTEDFLSGGVFSYDGVHPSDVGHALAANEWIAVINANGGSLPPVSLGEALGLAAGAAPAAGALRASASSWVPFELTAEAYAALLAAFPTLER